MLSKVLTGRQTENVSAAVFPNLGAQQQSVGPDRPANPADDLADIAGLREQIHRLEAQRAIDRRESFEAGRQQGEQNARAELQPVLQRFNAAVGDVTSLRPEMRRRAERDTVQLALLIAKRVLHRDLSVDENALAGIVRVAFERLARSESYTVTVHPRFAAAITAALPGSQSSRVRIEPDAACAPGTLVIHSAEGVIDASIDTQLEEISRGLVDRLGH